MAITRETVLHVARLARLELSPAELSTMQEQLAHILDYVEQLAELSTDDIPETAHMAEQRAVFREDALVPSLDDAAALGEAPRRAPGGFAVPAFVDE